MSNPAPEKSMRTFYTIWLGQLISVLGSSLTSFAIAVYIVQQTGKATPFAITVLFGTLPGVLLAPFAGSIIDRVSRRTVMILADVGSAILTAGVMLIILYGDLQLWHIYGVALLGSIFGTFQQPAYSAAITMIVPKEQFGRASGMVQTAQGLAQLFAPVVAGFLFVAIGLRGIILIDFVSFFFAVGALFFVHIPDPERVEIGGEKASMLKDAQFGLQYITQRGGLLAMLIYFSLVNFFANFSAVLSAPMILATSTPDTLGIVQAVSGAGLLVGSLIMSAWGGLKGSRKMLGVYLFILLFSLGFLIFGLYPSPWVYALGFAMVMFAMPLASGHSQPIWQSKVEPGVQGRVFASRQAISRALMPIAFLAAGPLADNVFEPAMQPGGALTSLGWLVGGTGAGRGIALIFVFSGVMLLLVSVLAYLYAPLREVEKRLPDVVDETEATEAEAPFGAEPEPAAP